MALKTSKMTYAGYALIVIGVLSTSGLFGTPRSVYSNSVAPLASAPSTICPDPPCNPTSSTTTTAVSSTTSSTTSLTTTTASAPGTPTKVTGIFLGATSITGTTPSDVVISPQVSIKYSLGSTSSGTKFTLTSFSLAYCSVPHLSLSCSPSIPISLTDNPAIGSLTGTTPSIVSGFDLYLAGSLSDSSPATVNTIGAAHPLLATYPIVFKSIDSSSSNPIWNTEFDIFKLGQTALITKGFTDPGGSVTINLAPLTQYSVKAISPQTQTQGFWLPLSEQCSSAYPNLCINEASQVTGSIIAYFHPIPAPDPIYNVIVTVTWNAVPQYGVLVTAMHPENRTAVINSQGQIVAGLTDTNGKVTLLLYGKCTQVYCGATTVPSYYLVTSHANFLPSSTDPFTPLPGTPTSNQVFVQMYVVPPPTTTYTQTGISTATVTATITTTLTQTATVTSISTVTQPGGGTSTTTVTRTITTTIPTTITSTSLGTVTFTKTVISTITYNCDPNQPPSSTNVCSPPPASSPSPPFLGLTTVAGGLVLVVAGRRK